MPEVKEMRRRQFIEEDLVAYLVNMIYKNSSDEVKREKYNLFYNKLDKFFSGKILFKDVINIITADIKE